MSLDSFYLRNISQIFTYYSEKGLLSKLHPVSKIVLTLTGIVIAFTVNKVEIIGITLGFYILLSLSSISWRRIIAITLSLLLIMLPMILFIYLYTLLQKPTTNTIISITSSTIITLSRLMIMAVSFYILLVSTKPQSLATIISRLGIPFKYSYSFVLALKLLSVIARDLVEILYIQRLRGLTFEKNLVKRLRNYLSIFIPITISTLTRIDEITISLIVKGFGLRSKRTNLYKENIKIIDILSIVICISIIAMTIYFDI